MKPDSPFKTVKDVIDAAKTGDQYRKFLKDNEQSTKKLMGW